MAMLIDAHKLCCFGSHRVLEPRGVLPQAAWRIDNTPRAYANEILCDVEALNIDSASFWQIAEECEGEPASIGAHIMRTIDARGKQHNPITGSGGMFVGRIAEIGSAMRGKTDAKVGDRIASLVSLTLTPLQLDSIAKVDVATGRVWTTGKAILFESAKFARLPEDIPVDVALAVLDVAGAPAQVQRLAKPGQTVVVIGADGKSGVLCCAVAKDTVGPQGRVIGVAPGADSEGARLLHDHQYVDRFIAADARNAIALLDAFAREDLQEADLVINCVNVAGTELPSILCTKDQGTVYFFSMSTSFTAAALGAEGVGKDVTMIVGNGYTKGHAEMALQTLRDHPPLYEWFLARYGSKA